MKKGISKYTNDQAQMV